MALSTLAAGHRLLVLYDADCGFCTRWARVLRHLDQGRRLDLTALQAVRQTADVPPTEALIETIHVRDDEGRWSVGGAAWSRIGREVPLLRPLALVGCLPILRLVVERTYEFVARNRYRIARLLGDDGCRIETPTP